MRILVVALPVLAFSVLDSAAADPPLPDDLGALNPMVRERIKTAWQATQAEIDAPERWLELAQVYHAHEVTGLAEECYREAARLDPDNPKIWYQWALAQSDVGEPEAALQSLDRVLELTGDYAPAYWRQGDWLLEQGDNLGAEAAFRSSTQIDPEDLAGWVGLARILVQQGRYQQAVDILFKVLAADPQNGVAGQLMGTAFRAMGDDEGARRALSMATGMGAYFPDPWQEEMLAQATGVGNRLRLLSARLSRGEIEAVTLELQQLHRDHPNDIGVLNTLSEAYLHKRDIVAAREILQTAFKLDPTEFATLMHLAQTEKLDGNSEAALHWVDQAIVANPGHWQARFERAGILGMMNRYGDCMAALDTAMELGATQNPNAWLMRGDVLLRQSAWRRARDTFDDATLRFPYLGPAFLGLAMAEAELGEVADARTALNRARLLEQDPRSIAAIEQRIQAASNRERIP